MKIVIEIEDEKVPEITQCLISSAQAFHEALDFIRDIGAYVKVDVHRPADEVISHIHGDEDHE